MSEQRILITGGCGFIGMTLVKQLQALRPDAFVCVVDSLHHQVHGSEACMPPSSNRLEWVLGSVENPGVLATTIARFQPTTVFHLAAETGTGQSHDLPARYVSTNVTGTALLIEALRSVSSVSKVVLASSRAVYGEGAYLDGDGNIFFPAHRPADRLSRRCYEVLAHPESRPLPFQVVASSSRHPVRPASVYAATKLMQEQLLNLCGAPCNWDLTILRLQNVYGAGQSLRNPYTGVLTTLIQKLKRSERVDIFEDGTISRDFVHVEDVCRALLSAASTAIPHGTIIDIGSGQSTPLIEIAHKLKGLVGQSASEIVISHHFRPGDIRHALADIAPAREWMQWSPEIDFETGLADFAQWALSSQQSAVSNHQITDSLNSF